MRKFALSAEDVVLLREWWGDCDRSDHEITMRFGWDFWTIHKYRRELGLPRRERRKLSADEDPTPEEIAEECLKIQQRRLQVLLDEPEEVTARRVADHRGGQRSIRCFTYAGECYQQAEPLA